MEQSLLIKHRKGITQ